MSGDRIRVAVTGMGVKTPAGNDLDTFWTTLLSGSSAAGPITLFDTSDHPVTFTKDIAPILQRSCQNCHRPNSMAPMPLLTYQDARPWSRSIKEKVVKRNMPPWFVDRSVGIHEFKDDPSLTDQEIATIAAWVDAGAPEGNRADMPPPRQFEDSDKWHIGKPDLIVSMKLCGMCHACSASRRRISRRASDPISRSEGFIV